MTGYRDEPLERRFERIEERLDEIDARLELGTKNFDALFAARKSVERSDWWAWLGRVLAGVGLYGLLPLFVVVCLVAAVVQGRACTDAAQEEGRQHCRRACSELLGVKRFTGGEDCRNQPCICRGAEPGRVYEWGCGYTKVYERRLIPEPKRTVER